MSLVEILIGTMLSLFLIGGLLQISNSTRVNNKLSDSLTEVQENGRFALEQVVSAVRYRGFQGCITSKVSLGAAGDSGDVASNKAKGIFVPSNTEGHIRGYDVGSDGSWNEVPPLADLAALANNGDPAAIDNSDVISIMYASPTKATLAVDMEKRDDTIEITSNPLRLKKGDLDYIGNCASIEAFRITNEVSDEEPFLLEHDSSLNEEPLGYGAVSSSSNTFFNGVYKAEDSSIRTLRVDTFYVGDTGRVGPSGNPIYALYRLDAMGETTELIEGVENLQVYYGEETNATDNIVRYVPATDVGDWANIKSVQLYMLIASTEASRNSTDDKLYDLGGFKVGSTSGADAQINADKRMRRVFSTTVNLRNIF